MRRRIDIVWLRMFDLRVDRAAIDRASALLALDDPGDGQPILWVIFGALLTRSRPLLRWLHIASLLWGILTEVLPWRCPLTLLENWLEGRAGIEPYQGGFLLHYLDKLVYPDISANVLTIAGVIVYAANLAFYTRQVWISRHAHR